MQPAVNRNRLWKGVTTKSLTKNDYKGMSSGTTFFKDVEQSQHISDCFTYNGTSFFDFFILNAQRWGNSQGVCCK